MKLIGELHEVYGRRCRAPAPSARVALMQAWAERARASTRVPGGGGVAAVLGTADPQGAAGPAAPPLRPQPDHARAVPDRRRGGGLPQPPGHAARSASEIRKDLHRIRVSSPRGVTHRGARARPPARLGVAGADHPVRRRVGRVGQVDLHRAGDPRPLDHERERIRVRPEQVALGRRRPAPSRRRRSQREVRVVDPQLAVATPRPGSGRATTAGHGGEGQQHDVGQPGRQAGGAEPELGREQPGHGRRGQPEPPGDREALRVARCGCATAARVRRPAPYGHPAGWRRAMTVAGVVRPAARPGAAAAGVRPPR